MAANQRLIDLIKHRQAREKAVLDALAAGATDICHIADRVYPDILAHLIPAARRNVLAHLIDLEGRNMISATPYASPNATFFLA